MVMFAVTNRKQRKMTGLIPDNGVQGEEGFLQISQERKNYLRATKSINKWEG